MHGCQCNVDHVCALRTDRQQLISAVFSSKRGGYPRPERDTMECAPAFVFTSARDAQLFRRWIGAHLSSIRGAAESASPDVRLRSISSHVAANVVVLRFECAACRDAGRDDHVAAMYAACEWVKRANPAVLQYFVMSAGARRVVEQSRFAS